jgi:uncharacterized protein
VNKKVIDRILFFLLFSQTLFSLSGCSHVFYQPDSKTHYPPEAFGLKYESIFFKSKDGTQLHAWLFHPKQKSKGTILQFHGNAENLSSHYVSIAWLIEQGYQHIVFDYRGYGLSEGKPEQKGVYEDGIAALEKALEIHEKEFSIHSPNSEKAKFIVFGQSLGGAVALRAIPDFQQQSKIDLVVADSTFSSYVRVARRKLASNWITWILSPLSYLLVSDAYAPEDVIEKIIPPLLIIHDEYDPVVSIANGEDISDALSTSRRKGFWKTQSGHHVAIFMVDGKRHRQKFLDLLQTL